MGSAPGTVRHAPQRTDRRVRAWWVVAGVPAFGVGGGLMAVMGEVVGEALGGPYLHALGHAVGTMLLLWLLVGTGWMRLRARVPWATRWAVAGAAGSVIGLLLYVLWLTLWTESALTIALSLHLPLGLAAVAQAARLRGHLVHPGRWVGAWYLAVLLGIGVAWFAGGGVAGMAAGDPFPVFEKAVAYFWRMTPQHLLGGVVYATWTALAVPLKAAGASEGEEQP